MLKIYWQWGMGFAILILPGVAILMEKLFLLEPIRSMTSTQLSIHWLRSFMSRSLYCGADRWAQLQPSSIANSYKITKLIINHH